MNSGHGRMLLIIISEAVLKGSIGHKAKSLSEMSDPFHIYYFPHQISLIWRVKVGNFLLVRKKWRR